MKLLKYPFCFLHTIYLALLDESVVARISNCFHCERLCSACVLSYSKLKIAVPRIPHCHSFIFAASVFAQIKRRQFFFCCTESKNASNEYIHYWYVNVIYVFGIRVSSCTSQFIWSQLMLKWVLNWIEVCDQKKETKLVSYFWHCKNWRKQKIKTTDLGFASQIYSAHACDSVHLIFLGNYN